MDEDLISKKELLELTGISYGQLYRWKRKGLVPEDWFIRKATYTGQETFFPRFRILSRIEKIKSMKEDVSLDDLADVFSPSFNDLNLGGDELVKRGIVSREVLGIYLELRGGDQPLDFNDTVCAYVLGGLLTNGDINLDEARVLLDVMKDGLTRFKNEACEVLILRKLGVFSCLLFSPPCNIVFDKGVKQIGRVAINSVIEALKIKLI